MRKWTISAVTVSGLLALAAFNPVSAPSPASARSAVASAYETSTRCPPVSATASPSVGGALYDHECLVKFRLQPGMHLYVKLTGEVDIADFGVFEVGGQGRLIAEAEYVGDEWVKLWRNDTGGAAEVMLRAEAFSLADSEKDISAEVRVEEPNDKVRHAVAFAILKAAGIKWKSAGNCTDRNNEDCTSYEKIRVASVNGAVLLKESLPEDCKLTVTGGTERGHSEQGTRTHRNGYKLDFSPEKCLSDWIRANSRYDRTRGDNVRVYRGNLDGRSVEYADERASRDKPHWDITFE
ncbi:hypothetical protein [Streptomyces sp. NPDC002889]|uniref:hypothetical protein n=1 Tax=Streptomyces sp. NPDC002889 TaxID=3364669 RepID=UPI00369FABD3